jgi:hypothetical protein
MSKGTVTSKAQAIERHTLIGNGSRCICSDARVSRHPTGSGIPHEKSKTSGLFHMRIYSISTSPLVKTANKDEQSSSRSNAAVTQQSSASTCGFQKGIEADRIPH